MAYEAMFFCLLSADSEFEGTPETKKLKSVGFATASKKAGWIISVCETHRFGKKMEFDSQQPCFLPGYW